MAINAAYVLNIAPELSTETTQRINDYIEIASLYVNSSAWGAKTDYAHALFTAHLLTTSPASSTGASSSGPISMQKVGDLQIGYAVEAASPDSLSSTKYGALFLQLRKTILITPLVIC